jgi:serine/threonine protein kinase/tetratricopeptide (TPR) repeat protein
MVERFKAFALPREESTMVTKRLDEEAIFHAARRLENPDQRDLFIQQACVGNAELAQRVHALLAMHAAESELEEPGPAGTVDQAPIFEKPGSMIGPYKLKEQIGEGGFGLVFVAEQQEPVKRKIALKIIKPGMDTLEVIARFTAERQALALMDHPNIARVLDAGATDSGQPYFVMELVRGIPITDYCDQNQLAPRERLELFVSVCQAVQHAHQKGIIHRDIKPSNVLVTAHDGKPVAKVIDFGVAKAINQQLTERSIYTKFAQMIGTPLYMSPEQAEMSGLDIDTRTDIYSLGVLLYELLTGTTPLDKKRFAKAAYDEIRRMIRDEDPPRPSNRLSTSDAITSIAAQRHTEPAKLSKLVRGDLDWITMKALEKDRTRRYETANSLARDIQRYLSDEPVEACPPGTGYRLKKLIRKHKRPVLAGAAVMLALAAGVVAVVTVQVRANRDLAAKNAELAHEQATVEARNQELAAEQAKVLDRFDLAASSIKLFHTVVSEDDLLKNDGFKKLRTKLLKEAARFYTELEKLLAGQTDARSRRALAAGYVQLAELTDKIGSKTEALSVHRQALAIRRELATGPEADGEARLDVARSLNKVGELLSATGDKSGAVVAFEEQRDVAQREDARYSTETARSVLGQSYHSLGAQHMETGKLVEALSSYGRALAIQEKLANDKPASHAFRIDLAKSQNSIGNLQSRMGKLPEALEAYRKALALRQQAADANPTSTDLQKDLAKSQMIIGMRLLGSGKTLEGYEAYRRAIAIGQKLAEDNPAVAEFQVSLAHHLTATSDFLSMMGKLAEAQEAYRKAIAIYQKLVDDNPDVIEFQVGMAVSHEQNAWLLLSEGKLEEGIEACHKALAINRKLAEAAPAVTRFQSMLADNFSSLGFITMRTGKTAEALDRYRRALAIRQKLADDYPSDITLQGMFSQCQFMTGDALWLMGRPAEAMDLFRKGLAIRQKLANAHPNEVFTQRLLGHGHFWVGQLLLHMGKPAEALDPLHKALAIWQRMVDADPSALDIQDTLASYHIHIGRALCRLNRFAEALTALDAGLAIREKYAEVYAKDIMHTCWLGLSYADRGSALARAGQPAKATADLRRALGLWASVPRLDIEAWIDRARVLALLAKLAGDASSGVTAAEAKSFADQSVALLKDVVNLGWCFPTELKEPEFDAIRKRSDFQKLLADVEARAAKAPQ